MSFKWSGESQYGFKFKETRPDGSGGVLHFYTTDMGIDPMKRFEYLSPEKEWGDSSRYDVLSRATKGLKRRFDMNPARQYESVFATPLDTLLSAPKVWKLKRETKKNVDYLDDMINFLEDNDAVIREDEELWQATEDWILSYLTDVASSDVEHPALYAERSLQHYNDNFLC